MKKTKPQLSLPEIRKELKALLTLHGVLSERQLESLQFAVDRLKLTNTCGLCGKHLEN